LKTALFEQRHILLKFDTFSNQTLRVATIHFFQSRMTTTSTLHSFQSDSAASEKRNYCMIFRKCAISNVSHVA